MTDKQNSSESSSDHNPIAIHLPINNYYQTLKILKIIMIVLHVIIIALLFYSYMIISILSIDLEEMKLRHINSINKIKYTFDTSFINETKYVFDYVSKIFNEHVIDNLSENYESDIALVSELEKDLINTKIKFIETFKEELDDFQQNLYYMIDLMVSLREENIKKIEFERMVNMLSFITDKNILLVSKIQDTFK
jgi:hypothetical protein